MQPNATAIHHSQPYDQPTIRNSSFAAVSDFKQIIILLISLSLGAGAAVCYRRRRNLRPRQNTSDDQLESAWAQHRHGTPEPWGVRRIIVHPQGTYSVNLAHGTFGHQVMSKPLAPSVNTFLDTKSQTSTTLSTNNAKSKSPKINSRMSSRLTGAFQRVQAMHASVLWGKPDSNTSSPDLYNLRGYQDADKNSPIVKPANAVLKTPSNYRGDCQDTRDPFARSSSVPKPI